MYAQDDMPAVSDTAAAASIEYMNQRMNRVDRMITDFFGYFFIFLFLGLAMIKKPAESYP